MVSEISNDLKNWLVLGMPLDQPSSPGFQIFKLSCKTIYQYLSYKKKSKHVGIP